MYEFYLAWPSWVKDIVPGSTVISWSDSLLLCFSFLYFGGVLNKTIPLVLFGVEKANAVIAFDVTVLIYTGLTTILTFIIFLLYQITE